MKWIALLLVAFASLAATYQTKYVLNVAGACNPAIQNCWEAGNTWDAGNTWQ